MPEVPNAQRLHDHCRAHSQRDLFRGRTDRRDGVSECGSAGPNLQKAGVRASKAQGGSFQISDLINQAMLFSSYIFLFAFLPVTLVGFCLLARCMGPKPAKLWLTVSSLVFYGWWN